jgi:hypothetical protein
LERAADSGIPVGNGKGVCMKESKIDIKKDHLVISRNKDGGEFLSFQWYSDSKVDVFSVGALILKYNENQDYTNTYELVTDKTVKEVCAYRQKTKPFEELRDEVKELLENINQAEEYLDNAQYSLGLIKKGLEL